MKKLLWSLGTLGVAAMPVLLTTACAAKDSEVAVEDKEQKPIEENSGGESNVTEEDVDTAPDDKPVITPAPEEVDAETFELDFSTQDGINEYKRLFIDEEIVGEMSNTASVRSGDAIKDIVIKIALKEGRKYVFNVAKNELLNLISQQFDSSIFSVNMTLDEFATMQNSVTGNFNQFFYAETDAENLGTTFGNSGDFDFQEQWFSENLVGELPSGISYKSFDPGWIDNNIEVTYTDGVQDIKVMYKLGEKSTQTQADEANADRGTNFTEGVEESKTLLSKSVAQLVHLSKYIDNTDQENIKDEWLGYFSQQQTRTGFDMWSALLGMGVFFGVVMVIPVLSSLFITFVWGAVISVIISAIIFT